MKIFLIFAISFFSTLSIASAKTQVIRCYGIQQTGTLSLNSQRTTAIINDEGRVQTAHNLLPSVNKKKGTVTFKDATLEITVPADWLGKTFGRLTKYDRDEGYLITESVSFDSIVVSECESSFE